MNTEIYLWIEPMIMNNKRCNSKVYLNCIIEGNYSKSSINKLESIIEGKIMSDIMDFANIHSNWNYGVISASLTDKETSIEFTDSPEEVEVKKEISLIVSGENNFDFDKENISILEDGKINISLPSLKISDKIDFPKIWNYLEKNFIGKIKEGDTVKLTDDSGNTIFEMWGGSFLNVGLADLSVYDKKSMDKTRNILTHLQGLKGGLFIRDDGSIDVGDAKRTFYLKIYTKNLLKASLKLNKTLMEITKNKLLDK